MRTPFASMSYSKVVSFFFSHYLVLLSAPDSFCAVSHTLLVFHMAKSLLFFPHYLVLLLSPHPASVMRSQLLLELERPLEFLPLVHFSVSNTNNYCRK